MKDQAEAAKEETRNSHERAAGFNRTRIAHVSAGAPEGNDQYGRKFIYLADIDSGAYKMSVMIQFTSRGKWYVTYVENGAGTIPDSSPTIEI